jgi:eukaryotic-like serine/threonine-protein kinase
MQIEARNLRSLLTERRLQTEEAVRLIMQCCKALDNSAGIIPSPRRIRISADLEVSLIDCHDAKEDLGYIAPEIVDAANLTSSRPGYHTLSAEGIIEPSKELVSHDSRAIVFALGSILWEMLAGRPLFRGIHSDYETLELVREARVPHLPGIAPELDDLVQRALAKDVERRFQTPDEFRDALSRHLTR